MSLSTWESTIAAGHVVVIYEGIGRLTYIVAEPGGTFNNRYGSFHHDDLIGKPFGMKWESRTEQRSGRRRNGAVRKGFVYALHPTPELWTHALAHRTQIIYGPDISTIVTELCIRPGSVVLETGTGSGSLTSALARSAMPTGHVHTFEYHEERFKKAQEDFETLGISDYVTVYCRNTMEDGFPSDFDGKADAVFLDLPGPWEVIPAAFRALKEAGSICSFSPCIEQVQRSCKALEQGGFHSIRTVEVRFTNYESKLTSQQRPDFGFSADTQTLESEKDTSKTIVTLGDQGDAETARAAKRQRIETAQVQSDSSTTCNVSEKAELTAVELQMSARPASEKQIGYLARLGCTTSPTDALHASRLIEEFKITNAGKLDRPVRSQRSQPEWGNATVILPESGEAATAEHAARQTEFTKQDLSLVSSRTLCGMGHSSYLTFATKKTTSSKIHVPVVPENASVSKNDAKGDGFSLLIRSAGSTEDKLFSGAKLVKVESSSLSDLITAVVAAVGLQSNGNSFELLYDDHLLTESVLLSMPKKAQLSLRRVAPSETNK